MSSDGNGQVVPFGKKDSVKLQYPVLILRVGDPLTSAKEIIRSRFTQDDQRTILHYKGLFYVWNGICYEQTENGTIRSTLYKILDKALTPSPDGKKFVPFWPTSTKVNSIMDALKAEAHRPGNLVQPPTWLTPDQQTWIDLEEIIVCRNGLLHLPSRRLLPPTPRYFAVNSLGCSYVEGAPKPTEWLKFHDSIFPDDHQAIRTLQEMFGYFLTSDTKFQKLFLIVGPKRAGKGTITRVLTALIGPSNCVAPTIAGLSKNFGLQPLIDKALAVIGDARIGRQTEQQVIVERLLTISGGDNLTIDIKFKDHWTGKLQVRFLLISNELPQMKDASGAFASRFIILVLRESFYGKEDLGLYDRLVLELPGILNWAIEGWERLRRRGFFEMPSSSKAAAQDLEDLSSPIGAFIRDCCVVEPGRRVEVGELFQKYKVWCAQQENKTETNISTFGRDLRAKVPGLERKQWRRKDGHRVGGYMGIGLA